jgi:DNA-binding protein HU-beta
MTKDDLIVDVQKATAKMDLSKAAVKAVVDGTFDALAKAIKKDKRFQVPGFGVFTVRSRKARMGRNPQTGATIKIKASKTVAFKPSPDLKKGL